MYLLEVGNVELFTLYMSPCWQESQAIQDEFPLIVFLQRMQAKTNSSFSLADFFASTKKIEVVNMLIPYNTVLEILDLTQLIDSNPSISSEKLHEQWEFF